MSDWSKAEVLRQLGSTAKPGERVRAQVFLNEDVGSDDLQATVKRIVADAEASGATRRPLEVGKIHRMAKSFSVEGDAETIAVMTEQPAVKTILPAEVSDIYPKPVKSK